MVNRLWARTRTLPARIILGFVVVILAAMLAVALPTLWLLRGELERQAQARLDQGASSTQAIFSAQLREVQALTALTAGRPTLARLATQNDPAALAAYLETIRRSANLDLLIALDPSGHFLAGAQLPAGWNDAAALALASAGGATPRVLRVTTGATSALVMRADAPVHGDQGAVVGSVVGGRVLDDNWTAVLDGETGLQHNLFEGGARVTSSVPGLPGALERVPLGMVRLDGAPFLVQALTLQSAPDAIVDVVALPASEVVATEGQLLQVFVLSTLVVALAAAALGFLLARRITAPLQGLVAASEGMGRGDLTTPIATSDSVVEVMTLARTLEQMRRRLRAAYDDLARAKASSENLIASMVEGVLTVDQAGRITSFSPGAERILGWRATDVIGRAYESVFNAAPGESPAPGRLLRQAVTTRDGRPIVLLTTGGAVTRHGEHSSEQTFVFRDVTEEEESLRLREFFLANVSHELKTPLSSLRASIELLAADLPSLSVPEQRELIDSMWLGTLRLEELIDNLMSSASIYSGQFEVRLEPTDLEAVLEEIGLTTRPFLRLRGQYLQVETPPALPLVAADARRLRQVLINLISNASKYGAVEAPITVRIKPRLNQLVVQVQDRGPGIPAELQPRLFEPFRRSDDAASGGVGLGLAIVKTIVEKHGGEVGVTSAPGGTTFWFTLNVCQVEAALPD